MALDTAENPPWGHGEALRCPWRRILPYRASKRVLGHVARKLGVLGDLRGFGSRLFAVER